MSRRKQCLVLPCAIAVLGCADPEAKRQLAELQQQTKELETRLAIAETRSKGEHGPIEELLTRGADHQHARISAQGIGQCGVDGAASFQGRTLVERSGAEECSLPDLGLRSLGSPCPSDYDVVVEVAAAESGAKTVTHRFEMRDRPVDSQGNATQDSMIFACPHPAFVTAVRVFGPGGGK